MKQKILSIGTKLADEYGIWIVTTRHHFDGSYWYDIRPCNHQNLIDLEWESRGEITLFPSNLKFYTILK